MNDNRVTWSSTNHPIADLKDWHNDHKIIIQPDYQRRLVWNQSAKIMLIDTILKNIPMPKIFLSKEINKTQSTVRKVIDGQQRINAILEFIDGKFALDAPYQGEYEGKKFAELPEDIQNQFLSYEINFNEVSFISEEQIREIYSRVNKYSFPLTTQELRKADYPGEFYKLAEKIASDEFFESIKLFTVANRRRSADVEYASELLAVLIDGPQEKKESLDSFYLNGTKWSSKEFEFYNERYEKILEEIKRIHAKIKLSNTRFHQKSDFYALFDAVRILVDAGGTLKDKDLTFLVKDLRFIDENISPNSQYSYLQEYALKCVSHANSKSSREWRSKILQTFLQGTFLCTKPDTKVFMLTKVEEHNSVELFDKTLTWPEEVKVFQYSNSVFK